VNRLRRRQASKEKGGSKMAKKGKNYVGMSPSIKYGKGGLSKEIQQNASDHADLVISKDMYKGGLGPKVGDGGCTQCGGIKEGY
jgi:hypothetical protein